MSIATQVLEKLFENRYNFVAPDSGPHKLPYTCSFHWFYTPQGQLIGVDAVRSDDMKRRALRVFAKRPNDETIRAMLLEGPSSDWVPFGTGAPPAMPLDMPFIGRGVNWVAASAVAPGQSISEVSFLLHLNVLVPGKGTGEAGLLVANMNAMDYLRVEFSGWISLNGQRTDLDRIVGYTSVHFGDFLPNYAAVAGVPPDNLAGSGILVNVTDKNDIRVGGELLGGRSVIYGYGSGLIPRLFVAVANLQKGIVPLGHAQLELSNINSLPHRLLDRDTTTAVANARHVSNDGRTVDLGQVILDFRGADYPALLAP
jgi:hypothetical protein